MFTKCVQRRFGGSRNLKRFVRQVLKNKTRRNAFDSSESVFKKFYADLNVLKILIFTLILFILTYVRKMLKKKKKLNKRISC